MRLKRAGSLTALGVAGLMIGVLGVALAGWGTPADRAAGQHPQCPDPCPWDQAVTPVLELGGDSNDEAAADWTPPVPLATGNVAAAQETEPAIGWWVPGVVREVVHIATATATPSPTPLPTPTPEPTGPIVYLTFDDGPHPTWTAQVLDVLARYGARGTFFVVGRNAVAYPDLVARARADGHGVGNHSWSHPYMAQLSRQAMASEIAWSFGAQGYGCGYTDCCFRPPYGSTSRVVMDVANSLGFSYWLWTIDPRDWSRPGTNTIVNHVLSRVQPGSVVLFHDGGGTRSQTVAALDIIVPELARRGYQFRPLPC